MDELDLYTPATLTHAVNQILPENLYLTKILDTKGPILAPTEASMFDVKRGRRDLAPMGHAGDPATRVDLAETFRTFTVTPPQIFLEDDVKASEVAGRRMAGQSPITVGTGNDSAVVAAFNDYFAVKQKNMVDSIARRVEWLWAQVISTGAIDYTDSNGRAFKVDYGVPGDNKFTASAKWDASSAPGDPILQLQQWQRTFAEMNGVKPTVMLLGRNAADAFRANGEVKSWLKSAGVQLLQLNVGVNEDLATPVATVPGVGTLVEYSAMYTEDGSAAPFVPADKLILTHPALFDMHYGAIYDFDLGANPIAMTQRYSKIKPSQDGKSKKLYVESHPLPVLTYDTGIMVIKVCGS